ATVVPHDPAPSTAIRMPAPPALVPGKGFNHRTSGGVMASPGWTRRPVAADAPGSLAVMDHRAEAWYRRRTTHWQEWPLERLLERKQREGARISVVIPARDEERTVASVVGPLHQALVVDAPLVDELVVIDSD